MLNPLKQLLNQQVISPLSYYFAQFISEQSKQPMDSLLCFSAALVSQQNQHGDICINLNEYENTVAFDVLDFPSFKFPRADEWIKILATFDCVSTSFDQQALILEGQSLYLGKLWYFEDFVAQHIKERVERTPNIDSKLLNQGLKRLFTTQTNGTDWQKVAASIAATKLFSVISGGPGTGKTTTLIKVLALLVEQEPNINIQLCAPTGKAAIRMLEAIDGRKIDLNLSQVIIDKIPTEAKTIHRLLKYQQGTFKVNKNEPLNVDCLVIDEASMIDLELMYHVMNALKGSCRIILLGDKDQLSSVDAGHVFSDICGRGKALIYSDHHAKDLALLNDVEINQFDHCNKVTDIADSIALLKTSYRFGDDSAIGRLAKNVNEGNGEAALNLLTQNETGLKIIPIENEALPKQMVDLAVSHYENVVEAKTVEQAITSFSNFQLLCAVHKGPFGVSALNEIITSRLILRHKINSNQHYNGKPILITQNDYDNNLFNGDIGMLWRREQQYFVYFLQVDGQLKGYPLISLSHYETAWAITVHKSQGSEYNEVLMLLPVSHTIRNISRELIYTGITRAKNVFNLCCFQPLFIKSCSLKTERKSNLSQKLGW